MLTKFSRLMKIVGLGLALTLAPTTLVASDGSYYSNTRYKKVVIFKTVEEQVVRKVPYQKKITKYDSCGRPYSVYVTSYDYVVETVCKEVPVVVWVKVCD